MIKEKGLRTDRPIAQYMALAIQPAMVGTFKREDVKEYRPYHRHHPGWLLAGRH